MRRRGMRLGDRRGSAAIEFALTLPIILMLISAVADYGWYLAQQTQALQAVGDGVRHGITVASDAVPAPEDAAVAHTQTVLSGLGIACDSNDDCEFNAEISTVGDLRAMRVSVSFNYTPIAGLVPNPDTIKAETVMAMEDQTGE